MSRFLLSLILPVLPFLALAQVSGGRTVYDFLHLPPSARVAALGGHLLAAVDDDVTLAARNPALLNPAQHGVAAVSHAFHVGDINATYLGYGRYLEGPRLSAHVALQYVGYGDLTRRDVTGTALGTFTANDYALTVGASRQVEERLTLGVNLKLINSQLDEFNSFGVATDLAALYQDTSRRFSISLVAQNFGRQLTKYDQEREPLPFELQIGLTKRLRYLPFQFSIIYRHLDRYDILYDDPDRQASQSIFIGEEEAERGAGAVFFDNFFRHFVFNGELFIGRKETLRVRAGYNHGLRKELTLTDYRSLAGYSFGFGIHISRFQLDFGRTTYHIGGGATQLSVSTKFGK